jgi:hypothetical protein
LFSAYSFLNGYQQLAPFGNGVVIFDFCDEIITEKHDLTLKAFPDDGICYLRGDLHTKPGCGVSFKKRIGRGRTMVLSVYC